MNAYSQFLIIQLAVKFFVIDPDLEYDLMWIEGRKLLQKFEASSFNLDSESEYDCMHNFLQNQKTFDHDEE